MLARLPRPAAWLVLLLWLAASVWCLSTKPPPIKIGKKGGYTDLRLYHDIAAAVAKGQPYHAAAAALHRAHNYPLKPFFTMRLPTLTELAVAVGWGAVQNIAIAVAFLATVLWVIAWMETGPPARDRILKLAEVCFIAIAFGCGTVQVVHGGLMALHEYWGGLAIAIALAGVIGWPQRWWAIALPIAAGLAIRELVLPFALLALAFALAERKWREALGWVAIMAGFALYMALHARLVGAVLRPGDGSSPGWDAMQGPVGFLKAVVYTSALQSLGMNRGMLAAMWPMFGWAALDGRRGLFCGASVIGYAVMIAAFSRPDTFYWGAIMLPWYFAGYGLIPRAAVQLAGALRGRAFATLGKPMRAA